MILSTADSSTLTTNEVARRLHVDIRSGLRWSEASYRSKLTGANEFNAKEEQSTWQKYFQQFHNPLILMLLGKFIYF